MPPQNLGKRSQTCIFKSHFMVEIVIEGRIYFLSRGRFILCRTLYESHICKFNDTHPIPKYFFWNFTIIKEKQRKLGFKVLQKFITQGDGLMVTLPYKCIIYLDYLHSHCPVLSPRVVLFLYLTVPLLLCHMCISLNMMTPVLSIFCR